MCFVDACGCMGLVFVVVFLVGCCFCVVRWLLVGVVVFDVFVVYVRCCFWFIVVFVGVVCCYGLVFVFFVRLSCHRCSFVVFDCWLMSSPLVVRCRYLALFVCSVCVVVICC